MTKFTPSAFPKIWATALIASATFTLVGSAAAQFSTNFQTGYTPNNSFGGLEQGWTTNDPYSGATYSGGSIGSTDDVSFINGFASNTSDLSASVGGNFAPSDVSGHPSVVLGHNLALGGAVPNVSVNLDFEVTSSSGSFPNNDSFGFALTDTTGASLFTLNFQPSVTAPTTFDNVTFTTATGTNIATGDGFFLNNKLHLTLSVNEATSTFSVVLAGTQIITNQAFTGGTLAGFSAIWNLADTGTTQAGTGGATANPTAYTDPGSNFLAFDNIVTTVPEPSTYVMLGAGALCLLAVARRRVA